MTLPTLIAIASFASIAAIWIGYPVLVWIFATLKRDKLQTSPARARTRSVSVVVATRERAEIVRRRVDNLLDSEHPAQLLEVVVALDAVGSMCTADELSDLPACVHVVMGDHPGGKASGLNAGVRAATGEILVLADAGQRFERATISELVTVLEDSRFGAVSGALQLGRTGRGLSPVDWYWAMEKWLRHNEARIHSSVGVTGAVYATRRLLWPTIPHGTLLDDVFVPMSLVLSGHRVGFTYAARATDVRVFDSHNEGARKTRTLTGVLQLRELLPGILSPRKNPIAIQFVAHKLLRLLTPLLSVIFAAAAVTMLVRFAWSATPLQLLMCAGVALVAALLPQSRRRIIGLIRWITALQMATLRAVINGASGKFGVWTKTKG